MTRNLMIIQILLAVSGCHKKVSANQSANESTSSSTCNWNEIKTYELCVDKKQESKQLSIISFELKNEKGDVIYSNTLSSGYVQWLNSGAIEFFQTPGMIPTTLAKDDFIKVYIIESGELMSKTEYLNQ